MVGLQRGTDDYKTILVRFQDKTYRANSYNSEAIRLSNPDWEAKYTAEDFANSIRHLASTVYLRAPPKPTVSSVQPGLPQQEEQFNARSEKTMAAPGSTFDAHAGASLVSERPLLFTPKHRVPWVDSHKNQNNRLTIYVHIPPGFPKVHFKAKISNSDYGDSSVVLTYTWPEEFLNDFVLNKGHNMYEEGHNKLVAFEKAVKELRDQKSDQPVVSEYCIPCPFPVEEQFTSLQVPRAVYTSTMKGGVRVLALELMGVRSNYEVKKVSKEFKDPAPPAPMEAQTEEEMKAELEHQAEMERLAELEDQQRQAQLEERERLARENQSRLARERREQERLVRLRQEQERLAGIEDQRRQAEFAEQYRLEQERQGRLAAEQHRLALEQQAAQQLALQQAGQHQKELEQQHERQRQLVLQQRQRQQQEQVEQQRQAAAAAAMERQRQQQQQQTGAASAAAAGGGSRSSLQQAAAQGKDDVAGVIVSEAQRRRSSWAVSLAENGSNLEKARKSLLNK